jgi:RNA polymerase sigma-70 factor (ECF subfamily)
MELKISTYVAAGDYEQALRLMAEAYSTSVARFCAGFCGSAAEADDLLQETFVDAWKAMHRFPASANAKGWLFGIARRVCIRYLRKRDRRADLVKKWCGEAKDPVSRGPSAEEGAEDAESQALLAQALSQLKPNLREAVLLYYQVGLSTAEMAESLGVKPATARKRVSLGVQSLRRSLRPLLMEPPSEQGGTTDSDKERDHESEDTVSARRGPRLVSS